jgi:hypothetical protein
VNREALLYKPGAGYEVPNFKFYWVRGVVGSTPSAGKSFFARTERPIGGGSRPPKGTQWAAVLVYATLWD